MDVTAANFSPAQLIDQCATTATPLLKPGVTLVSYHPISPVHSDQTRSNRSFSIFSATPGFPTPGRLP
jgi:hypothetical protein